MLCHLLTTTSVAGLLHDATPTNYAGVCEVFSVHMHTPSNN